MAEMVSTKISSEKIKEYEKQARRKKWKDARNNKLLYFMILPGLLYFIVFKYIPMGGIVIAFQDYQPFLGIRNSPWVGWKHFIRLFTEPTFFMLLKNTLYFFSLELFIFFPMPIILALLLNEIKNKYFKQLAQTILYIPHFMSWVIIVSISFVLLAVDGGIINEVLSLIGVGKQNFLTSPQWTGVVYIVQVIWKELGWSTIVYLAAITAVDVELYEAADIDGASLFRKMWHITLPAIRPVIVTLLILKVGDVLNLGFEHMYLLINPLNRSRAEIFDTYIYTAGLRNGQLSFSTAMGVFKGIVGLILVSISNKIANMLGEDGVY